MLRPSRLEYVTKPGLLPILKHRKLTVLKIQRVVPRQWLKLHLTNFTHLH